MTIRFRPNRHGGRLTLASGAQLEVRAKRGKVTFRSGALQLEAELPIGGSIPGVELTLQHPFTKLAQLWMPHLAPQPGFVIGDFVFRSPAIIFADGRQALALVPELADVAAARDHRVWLDYDHPRRLVTFAAGAYSMDGHVFFVRQPLTCRGQRVLLRLHLLASSRPADLTNPYGMVARYLWRSFGDVAQRKPPDVERCSSQIARWAFSSDGWGDEVWQSFDHAGRKLGAPVFIVDVMRHPSVPPAERTWREPRSIWNQAWFSTQRCANGLFSYARSVASADLERRARAMTQVALSAPQHDGLFPSVLTSDGEGDDGWRRARWTNSDRRPPSASGNACHIVDAAFTCRMLLQWQRQVGGDEALGRVSALANRLVRLQRPSGAFPGWIEPDGRVPSELAESAESAVSTTLLFELAAAPGAASEWSAAALRSMAFLEQVIGDARWEDFETYYSCAPWGAPEQIGRRVTRNGVYKQNTLSIFWCAEAMWAAFRATAEPRFARLARRCLDELSLYQAVWDPPFLPAPAFGGFGVMNADSEWNDARQSLFAPFYLKLGRALGDSELWQRGLSALAASFSMIYAPENSALARAYERRFPFFGPESYGFMMENQGHGTGDPIGPFTIFTWGNGSALAAAASVAEEFGALDGLWHRAGWGQR